MSKVVGTTVDLGLAIGPSFGELCAVDVKNKSVLWQRKSYLAKESTGTLLKKFIGENPEVNINQIKISCRFFEKIFNSRLGGSVAQVVTSGFETLPILRQPVGPLFFSMTPSRLEPLASQELIFGINERVSANGGIVKPIDLKELEFIAAKLKLQNIQKVVVNLLFSGKNNQHQQAVCGFFKEQGFQVFSQERTESSLDEVSAWRTQILNACLEGTFKDIIDDLIKNSDGKATQENIFLIDGIGQLHKEYHNHLSESIFSIYHLMAKDKTAKKFHLHLGYENWWLINSSIQSHHWNSPWGRLEASHPKTQRLALQPTQELSNDFWGDINFSFTELGFEPGPMSLGRAQKPLIFDLFAEDVSLANFDLIHSNGLKKFEQVLSAMGKATEKTSELSFFILKKNLQDKVRTLISMEISHQCSWNEVSVSGEMAAIIFPDLPTTTVSHGQLAALQGLS